MTSHRKKYQWFFDLSNVSIRLHSLELSDSTRDFAFIDRQMMSVQSNNRGRGFDVDSDLYNPLEAESTAQFKVEELDIVVDSFNAGLVNTRTRAVEDRTDVSGKMLRSTTAMVLVDLRRSVI